jgi:hypothetical protein
MKVSKFKLAAMAVVLLCVSGWATDKMRATVRIYDAVRVGSAQLAAGEYTIKWSGTASNAEVTFAQGRKVIATVPAQISEVPSGYANTVVETDTRTKTLTKIALPKQSFSFASSAEISGN